MAGEPARIPCSAFDFHILFDSSAGELDRIRGRLRIGPDALLYSGPFVITASSVLRNAVPTVPQEWLDWAERHQWRKLEGAVNALETEDDEGRSRLPRSQQHALRESLFLGTDIAMARLKAIRSRYDFDWDAITQEDQLFFPDYDPSSNTSVRRVGFLDAMTLADVEAQRKLVREQP